MQKVDAFIGGQDWQRVLEDIDHPGKPHNLELANIRMRMVGSGLDFEHPYLEYPPDGPRIIRSTMPWSGVVHNPGIPDPGQIIIQIDPTHLLKILVEFNYINKN